MLIKAIKLENFRQFKEADLKLATGEDGKNVTIIYGENGTGKTTFEQAFLWCLYDETSFSEKCLLNKDVEKELMPGSFASVVVTMDIEYNKTAYQIRREKRYKLSTSGTSLTNAGNGIKVYKTDEDGISVPVQASEIDSLIQQILPKDLAHYFFFDGERIDDMSKSIVNQQKSNEFQKAVKGLLGLQSFENAIDHLKSKRGVIKDYEADLLESSTGELNQLYQQKAINEEKLQEQETIISESDERISLAEEQVQEYTQKLKSFKESQELQEEKEKKEEEIRNLEERIVDEQKGILKEFNRSLESMFSVKLIEDALDLIEDIKIQEAELKIDDKFILKLLQRGQCICGHEIRKDSIEYETLTQLLDYVSPNLVGRYVNDFKKEAKKRIQYYQNTSELIGPKVKNIEDYNQEIYNLNSEIQNIDHKLNSDDVLKEIKEICKKIELFKTQVEENRKKQNKANQEIGRLNNELDSLQKRINHFINQNKVNQKTELYKNIAEEILEEFQEQYSIEEKKVRKKLQNNINEIFKQIYEGDLSLTIQDNYQVKVHAYDYVGNVETSTAQSIAVVFAFIAGIIKMARDKQLNSDEVATNTEPYPLIMDAPLSALDEKRIKAVSTTLPGIAEQILIFIKDVDGKIAEEYMSDRIGARYSFEKVTEFYTQLHLGGENV